jgi:hypothetical protein
METNPISEKLCFIIFGIPDHGQKSRNTIILGKIDKIVNKNLPNGKEWY